MHQLRPPVPIRQVRVPRRVGSVRWLSLVVGFLLIAVGFVWFFQGYGALKGSFMTGSPTWMWIGIASAIVGAVLVVRAVRRGGRT